MFYFYCIKKYFYYFLFFFFLITIILAFKELSNLDFFISVYKEEGNALRLVFNNLFVFLPFVLPLVFFYSLNLWLNYLKKSNILKRINLGGNSFFVIYLFIFFVCLIFLFISSYLIHVVVPIKISENNKILREIQSEKPYITLEPFVFNRLGHDYIVYFNEFGKNRKEIKNVIVYKLKKGRLKNLTHVKKGYIDNNGNLILTNGLSYVLGKSGEVGKPIFLKKNVNKKEIIEQGHFNRVFSDLSDIVNNKTTKQIIQSLQSIAGRTKYFAFYEIHRRISLSLSIVFFLIISFILYKSSLLDKRGLVFALSSIFVFVFIFKEIYIKLLFKHNLENIFFSVWFPDIFVFVLSIMILIIIVNKEILKNLSLLIFKTKIMKKTQKAIKKSKIKFILHKIISRLVLKKYFLLLIFVNFSLAVLMMIPTYLYFAINNFYRFENAIDVIKYFSFKFPRYACDSFIYALIFTIFMGIYYFKNSGIQKRVQLTRINPVRYKYLLLILSCMLLYINFFIKENMAFTLDHKAHNILYRGYKKYRDPAIFIGNNGIIYVDDYVESKEDRYLRGVVIDKIDDKIPRIITANKAFIKKNKLLLKNGVENILSPYNNKNEFNKMLIDFEPKTDQNLLYKSVMKMNISGLQKTINRNPYKDTSFIMVFKKIRYVSLINKVLLIFLVFLLFFDLNLRNIFYYYFFISIIILVHVFIEYKLKMIFLSLSLKNDVFILLDFVLILGIGVIIKAIMIIFYEKRLFFK